MRIYVLTSLLILGINLFTAAADKPNILYLYVDDMGWGSIGANGQKQRRETGKPYVMTPNLDKLADQGINFRRAYGCTVCSPARSSQQTGFHQGYTFADRNDPNNAKKAIRTDDLTMGDVLLKAGYNTGYWGKWGYGGSKDLRNPSLDNIQTLPTSHGYQFVVAELHHVRAHTFFQPALWTAPAAKGTKGGLELKANSMSRYMNNKAYPNYPAAQNHPDYPKVAYCDDVYAFSALDFIRRQAVNYNKTGQPFFGLFAAQIPHAPFNEVSKLPLWDQKYKDKPFFKKLNKQSQQWCAMVTRIDAHFGNILNALEDPNGDGDKSDSVAADTLVIFQSDNGGPGGFNLKELDANGGLSGTKGSIMEGGIRVPTIMRWPAKINDTSVLKAGTNSDKVIDCTDLLPTFAELAGVEAPVGINGVSIAPYLTGATEIKKREFLIHEAGNKASIIRGKWKLTKTRTGKKRKSKNTATGTALYNLENDPAEKNNIAQKNPELVKELTSLLTSERVDEPAGFANTYHQWLGKSGPSISAEENWSEYTYENAGVKYITEKGFPKSFWIAKMSSGAPAAANTKVEFLGLEVGGGASKQELTVSKNGLINSRNEIRISKNGRIKLNGGTLRSLQWLDIHKGGSLQGYGKIEAALICRGNLNLTAVTPLIVSKKAVLGGTLSVTNEKTGEAKSIDILQAESIHGKFENSVVTVAGKKYTIVYSPNAVSLKAVD